MTIKKICAVFLLSLSTLLGITAVNAQDPFGQNIQITTNFRSLMGKPTWLLVIRDVQNGQVLPYLYEIKNNDNFWIAFTYGHSYRVVASTLKFGRFAVINNFCHLENGILTGKSMIVTLTGDLTPNRATARCKVLKYSDTAFTIVSPS